MRRITYNGSSKVIIRLCELVNSVIDALSNKADIDDIPTNTSDLTNDSGFIINTVDDLTNYYLKTETYTQSEVDNLIANIASMHFEVVDELPSIPTPTNYSVYFLWTDQDLPDTPPKEYAFVWRNSNIYRIPISTQVRASVLAGKTDWIAVEELPASPSDTATYYRFVSDTDTEEILVYVSNNWEVIASIPSEDWWECAELDWRTYGEESNPEFMWDSSTMIVAAHSALQFPDTNVIYLVPSSDPQQQNVYDEYIFVTSLNNYEKIGTTAIDLSNYVTITMLNTALADYVTSADFQTALANYYTAADVDVLLAGKADTTDIPTELSDLNDDATHRLVTDTEKATWNAKSDFSGSYNDLTDKPTIPAAQIQSDWDQNDSTALDYIKNKPTIPSVSVTSVNGQTGAVVLDADDVGALPDSTPLFSGDYNDLTNKPTLATVATTGAYSDLSGTPTIPTVNNATLTIQKNGTTVQTFTANSSANKTANITVPTTVAELSDSGNYVETSDLAMVATSGSYNDLTDKPTIPTVPVTSVNGQTGAVVLDADDVGALPDSTVIPSKTSDLQNDSGFITSSSLPTVNNGTLTITQNGTSKGTFTANQSSNATIALTDTTYSSKSAASGGTDVSLVTTGEKYTWNNKSNFSGSYNDLTNKPTIPTVNNGTLTIQKNGTNVATFTANQSTAATANITVPTKTSDLQNDSGFISDIDNVTPTVTEATTRTNLSVGDTLKTIIGKIKKWFTDLKTVAFTGSYNDLTDKPTIPTVNNGTLTVTQNGTSKGTFTANQSGNSTIALTDTTYSSKTAASGGTAVSLVTTGEKYTWNNKSNFSGSYNDLTNKPTIPTVNNGTLTIQKNGTNVATFTANQSGNATANISVPTTPTGVGINNVIYNNTDIPEGAANLSATATAHKITTYRNGFTIPYQMDNANDGGMLRVRGTSESNCIFELGTWDDSGGGETIQFNYYPTTSQVTPTYSVSVPKQSGTIALTSQIPTTLPASDVYAWAKAASKPSYSYSEISGTPTISEAATGSTVLRRTGNGYAFAVYFNQSSGAEAASTSSYIMFANSDGYLRKGTLASIKTALGLGSAAYKNEGGTWQINITGSASSASSATWASQLLGFDTRGVNYQPDAYYNVARIGTEFKQRATIGAPGSSIYGTLITISPWGDPSGGLPVQLYTDNTGYFAIRYAASSSTWGSWLTILTTTTNIQRGSVTVTPQSPTAAITFGAAFSGTPTVMATVIASSGTATPAVYNISATGFTAYLASGGTMQWLAYYA